MLLSRSFWIEAFESGAWVIYPRGAWAVNAVAGHDFLSCTIGWDIKVAAYLVDSRDMIGEHASQRRSDAFKMSMRAAGCVLPVLSSGPIPMDAGASTAQGEEQRTETGYGRR